MHLLDPDDTPYEKRYAYDANQPNPCRHKTSEDARIRKLPSESDGVRKHHLSGIHHEDDGYGCVSFDVGFRDVSPTREGHRWYNSPPPEDKAVDHGIGEKLDLSAIPRRGERDDGRPCRKPKHSPRRERRRTDALNLYRLLFEYFVGRVQHI